MLYLMRCDRCEKELEIGCPINMHLDMIKPGIDCDCSGKMYQVMQPPRHVFMKSAFPRRGNELFLPTPHGVDLPFTDKIHCREYLAEHDLVSGRVENDC